MLNERILRSGKSYLHFECISLGEVLLALELEDFLEEKFGFLLKISLVVFALCSLLVDKFDNEGVKVFIWTNIF